jgi:hypothetical protein
VTAPAQLDPETAFQQFLPAAQAIAADDVIAYYLDPEQILGIVRRSMQVLVAYKKQIPRHLPRMDRPALEALPALGLALSRSIQEAEKAAPNEQILRHTVAEARQLRGMIWPIVAGLAANRLVPQEHHESSSASKPRDVAAECVALSSIFKTYADALRNKHAADSNVIHRAATVGTWLLENLRAPPIPTRDTKGTPPPLPTEPPSPPPPAAVDLRDRFETLMVERYGKLRTVARYFCGEDYELFAPPLFR